MNTKEDNLNEFEEDENTMHIIDAIILWMGCIAIGIAIGRIIIDNPNFFNF